MTSSGSAGQLPLWVNLLTPGAVLIVVALIFITGAFGGGDPDFLARGRAAGFVLEAAGAIMVLLGILVKKYRPDL